MGRGGVVLGFFGFLPLERNGWFFKDYHSCCLMSALSQQHTDSIDTVGCVSSSSACAHQVSVGVAGNRGIHSCWREADRRLLTQPLRHEISNLCVVQVFTQSSLLCLATYQKMIVDSCCFFFWQYGDLNSGPC
jgi:hypothetical protein